MRRTPRLLPWLGLVVPAALLTPTPSAQTVLHAFDGAQVGGAAGRTVTSAGDVDADGFDDVLVGEPDYDRFVPPSTLLVNAGRVRVFSGRTGALIHTHLGTANAEHAGWSLAGGGNLDGDAHAEYAFGSSLASAGGRVTIVRGSSGQQSWFVGPGAAGEELGRAIAFVDLQGNARHEVVLGVPGHDQSSSVQDTGEVWWNSYDGSGQSGVFFDFGAIQAGARFGASLDGAGDWNGDGYEDVVVGAPGYDAGSGPFFSPDAGRAVVMAREFAGFLPKWSATGVTAGRAYGSCVAGVADGDGDGWPEVVIGAPSDDAMGTDAGMVHLVHGPDGATSVSRFGRQAGERYGETVAGIGDYDGDGRGDFAVGAPFHTAGTFPLLFADGGRVELLEGEDALVHLKLEGLGSGQQLGRGLGGSRHKGGADTNGDGLDEAFLGAPAFEVAGNAVGRAVVQTMASLPAEFDVVGTGLAGTNGVPGLTLGSPPVIGSTIDLVMTSSAPAPAVAWVHLGFVQVVIPAKGGILWVQPLSSLPIPLAPGSTAFPLSIPADALLALGPPLLLQLTVPDPGAPVGWAFSKLLRVGFGY